MIFPEPRFLLVWPRLINKWSQLPPDKFLRFKRFYAEIFCGGFSIMPRHVAEDLFQLFKEGCSPTTISFVIYDPLPNQPYVFTQRNYT